ncbi:MULTISPECIES: hypothetical protein [unclassified Microbacterium]|uniref:hypothetical protein n=1 Tax=unclassified Microbacterium TaxID=2609290 RepID=UPI000CFBB0C2|nr:MULTISPECIES: hypothetical protein [unclassified Microbacterium]PQZ54851.1 hypothetical protein CQ032_13140 [Microbacterium sp. MYb43]PRB25902.1 hypothetical protein CQ037_14320 [Microbacterium sp. MYb50]PRB64396.1 hypothetical protein CQ021_14750 [Microbacterium sp. MYb24]PRB73125.1 hypothetical protein CQ027_14090 [Microbacterium sp. MYb32]
MTRMQRRTLWISIAGVLAVTAYAALAAVQILVLNPLAAAPGLTLDEIGSEMANAGENLSEGAMFFILGIGVVFAVVLAVVSIGTGAHPLVPTIGFLVLLMLGTIGYFAASFGAGMGLADAFGISGGDYSPWAVPLYAVSALYGVALVVVGIMSAVRQRPARAVA